MPDPYEHKPFPKMVYFENGTNRIVRSQDELDAAKQEGARESPADFTKDTATKAAKR